jgi:hypothetical protein
MNLDSARSLTFAAYCSSFLKVRREWDLMTLHDVNPVVRSLSEMLPALLHHAY